MTSVVVYTRQGCKLCKDAEELVGAMVAARPDVRVEHVDIDQDPGLVDRYGIRVPVVAIDGVEVGELFIEPDVLADALAT